MPEVVSNTRRPHSAELSWDDGGALCETKIRYLHHVEVDGEVMKHAVTDWEWLDHKSLAKEGAIAGLNTDALASVNRLNAEVKGLKAEAKEAVKASEEAITDLEKSLATVTQQKMEQATRAATAEGLLADTQQTLSTVVAEAQDRIAELEAELAAALARPVAA